MLKVMLLLLLLMDNYCLGKTMLIGHRGAGLHAPENTIDACKKALSLPVQAVELDVRRCKSGELVLMHDDYINRVTNGSGLVKDKTLHELKSLLVEKNAKIATFNEVLTTLAGKVGVVIDIKDEDVSVDIATIIKEHIDSGKWQWEQFWGTGFFHHELVQLKQQCPKIRLIPAVAGSLANGVAYLHNMQADGICILNVIYAPQFIKELKENGFRVWFGSFGPVTQKMLAEYKKMDFDAAILDNPEMWQNAK